MVATTNNWSTRFQRNPKLTRNQEIVSDIADSISSPPPDKFISQDYLRVVSTAASFLGNPSDLAADFFAKKSSGKRDLSVSLRSPQNTTMLQSNVLSPSRTTDASKDRGDLGVLVHLSAQEIVAAAHQSRANVLAFKDQASSFVSRAKISKVSAPANPFSTIESLNVKRIASGTLGLDFAKTSADSIVSSLGFYTNLIKQEIEIRAGNRNDTGDAVQISSMRFSIEGFGFAGNSVTDMLTYIPSKVDLTKVQDQNARQSKSFRSTIPSIVFVVEYAPARKRKGLLVGFLPVANSTGYVIQRRNVLDGTETVVIRTSAQLAQAKASFTSYITTWATGFYDDVDPAKIEIYYDSTVKDHSQYMYVVHAYQQTTNEKDFIFSVATKPMSSTKSPVNPPSTDLSNPYALLSISLYGSDDFDWVLAGLNFLNKKSAAGYAYSNTTLTTAEHNSLVMPIDITDVEKNYFESVNTYGLLQTLEDMMVGTGIQASLQGFDTFAGNKIGKGFTDLGYTTVAAAIKSSIDTKLSTLDLSILKKNMTALFGEVSGDTSFSTRLSELTGLFTSASQKLDLLSMDGVGAFMKFVRQLVITEKDLQNSPVPPTPVPVSPPVAIDITPHIPLPVYTPVPVAAPKASPAPAPPKKVVATNPLPLYKQPGGVSGKGYGGFSSDD